MSSSTRIAASWSDLLEADHEIAPTHGYFLGQIDTDDHGWLTVEVEPREPEDVSVYRFDNARHIADIWMGFHALWDFDTNVTASVFDGFRVTRGARQS